MTATKEQREQWKGEIDLIFNSNPNLKTRHEILMEEQARYESLWGKIEKMNFPLTGSPPALPNKAISISSLPWTKRDGSNGTYYFCKFIRHPEYESIMTELRNNHFKQIVKDGFTYMIVKGGIGKKPLIAVPEEDEITKLIGAVEKCL